MNKPPEPLTDEELEREIARIDALAQDERIRQTIIERIAIADDPATVFVPNDEVVAESRARLMAKLTSKGRA
jgi:hypothetical protein